MDAAIERLKELQRLLAMEKEADLKQWQGVVKRMSLAERLHHGMAWQPVQVLRSGFALGDKASVTVQRKPGPAKDSRFKAGAPVTFYTTALPDGPLDRSKLGVAGGGQACRAAACSRPAA